MNPNILRTLLAQRLDPKYHRLSGLDIVWLDENGIPAEDSFYRTPEHEAIVEDVVANYDTLAAEYQSTLDAVAYKAKRAAEYPPMADYLDGIVKGDQAQINQYIADCLAVKAKYPKT